MLTAALIASLALLVLVLREHRAIRARAFMETPALAHAGTGPVPVTVLLPARNESAVIADALRTIRAQTSSVEKIVVIDDASTDDTGARARSALAGLPHAIVVRVEGVPEGWTGKTHALERGLAHASSDWILTVDADVFLAPDAIARAYATACAESLDALSLSPTQDTPARAVRALQEAAYALLDRLYPFSATARPDSSETAASGAFFLVRRSALGSVGAFASVRTELVEDLALARALVAHGARVSFRPARGAVHVRMYRSLGDAFAGWKRLLAPLVDASPRGHGVVREIVWHAGLAAAVPFAVATCVWTTLHSPLVGALLAGAIGATVLALGGVRAALRWMIGRALLAAALRASIGAHRSSAGVQWKGRVYAAPHAA